MHTHTQCNNGKLAQLASFLSRCQIYDNERAASSKRRAHKYTQLAHLFSGQNIATTMMMMRPVDTQTTWPTFFSPPFLTAPSVKADLNLARAQLETKPEPLKAPLMRPRQLKPCKSRASCSLLSLTCNFQLVQVSINQGNWSNARLDEIDKNVNFVH